MRIKPKRVGYYKHLAREKKIAGKIEKVLTPLGDAFSSGMLRMKLPKFRKKPKVIPFVPHPNSVVLRTYRTAAGGFYRRLSDSYPYRIHKKNRVGGRPWHGPYPNPLGIRKILSINISAKGMKFLMDNIYDAYYLDEIKHAITDAMRDLWTKIWNYGKTQINRYVPKDSGDLRKSLIQSLSDDPLKGCYIPNLEEKNPRRIRLEIRIFSDITYGGIVNNMPNDFLQHPNIYHLSGMKGKSGKTLNDPHAVKGFFSMVILKIKMMIKGKYIRAFIKDIEETFGSILRSQIKMINKGIYEAEMLTRNSIDYRERQTAKKLQTELKKTRIELRTLTKGDKISYKKARSMFKITTYRGK